MLRGEINIKEWENYYPLSKASFYFASPVYYTAKIPMHCSVSGPSQGSTCFIIQSPQYFGESSAVPILQLEELEIVCMLYIIPSTPYSKSFYALTAYHFSEMRVFLVFKSIAEMGQLWHLLTKPNEADGCAIVRAGHDVSTPLCLCGLALGEKQNFREISFLHLIHYIWESGESRLGLTQPFQDSMEVRE